MMGLERDQNITPTEAELIRLRDLARRLDRESVLAIGLPQTRRELMRERTRVLHQIDALRARQEQDQERAGMIGEYLEVERPDRKRRMSPEDAYQLLKWRAREAGYIPDTEDEDESR